MGAQMSGGRVVVQLKSVSATEAQKLMKRGYVLVDVRPDNVFDEVGYLYITLAALQGFVFDTRRDAHTSSIRTVTQRISLPQPSSKRGSG